MKESENLKEVRGEKQVGIQARKGKNWRGEDGTNLPRSEGLPRLGGGVSQTPLPGVIGEKGMRGIRQQKSRKGLQR